MATHLHIQIPELYHRNDTTILWFSDTQARESTTEEMNRIIRKLTEYLNWTSPWAAAVVNSLWYKGLCLDCRAFLFPFKLRLPQATRVCEILVRTAARGGDAVQETQPHFPSKNMPPSTKRQQLCRREQPRASSFSPAPPGSLHSCPAETHPGEKPRENTGTASCFTSHLAALETNVKQPVILTCGCTAHSLLCHPFPPGEAHGLSAWSRQLWFLGSQPLHHRAHECSEGVSSLSRPLCHPDINANGKNWATAWTYSFCMCILPPHCHLVNTPSIDQFINQEN